MAQETGMKPAGHVLIVDDDEGLCESFRGFLRHAGFSASSAGTGAEAVRAVAAEPTDVVLLDLRLGQESGLDVLPDIKALRPEIAVLMVTAMGSIETAVEAMRRGADNFVTKPLDPARLLAIIVKALEARNLRHKNLRLERLSAAPPREIGTRSPAMQRALDLVESVAARETVVLLLGETGTGKGLLARRLHALSPRRSAPFVELNCAGLQRDLTESELFGHERGAFTGAVERKIGLFEAAQEGTLFLDEIGEMDLGVQAKLLHVLEERRFRRVGGTAEIAADVRVLAATHRDLERDAAEGRFRSDLLYRLNVFPVPIPPLRERHEDVIPMALSFLAEFRGREGTATAIAPEAADLLTHYSWPGNVRELRNVMERTAILTRSDETVRPEHLPAMRVPSPASPPEDPIDTDDDADTTTFGDAERKLVEQALQACGGNIVAAAKRLGVSRGKLYRTIHKYGLPVTRGEGE
jgi:two-component system, NtrC family, response regulator AtoC